MKILKNIILFIINPFRTFGLGRTSDKVVKYTNNNSYVIYILSFIIAAAFIIFYYFI